MFKMISSCWFFIDLIVQVSCFGCPCGSCAAFTARLVAAFCLAVAARRILLGLSWVFQLAHENLVHRSPSEKLMSGMGYMPTLMGG